MPIRINLLAETQAEEELRRRDPVKRSIYLGVLLVCLSLVWFSSTWLKFVVAKNGLSQVQNSIQDRTGDFNQVQLNRKKIADIQRRIDALQQLSHARFLQGNLLNAVQQTYVPNVQLTRMRVDQTYLSKEGTPAKTNNAGVVVAGLPPAVTQRILLTLDAKDSSANSGDQVNRFKDTFSQQDFFKSNLDPTNGVRLSNLSAPQTGPDGKSFVMFTVECRFQDKTQ